MLRWVADITLSPSPGYCVRRLDNGGQLVRVLQGTAAGQPLPAYLHNLEATSEKFKAYIPNYDQ